MRCQAITRHCKVQPGRGLPTHPNPGQGLAIFYQAGGQFIMPGERSRLFWPFQLICGALVPPPRGK
jgi:hypothetical protein